MRNQCSAVALFLLLSSSALAGPFVDYEIGGDCTKNNSQLLENGDTVSVIFDNFGVNLRDGERSDGLAARKNCWLRLKVKAPKEKYLASLEQVFRGGVVKSRDAAARFVLRYNLAHIDRERIPMNWPRGREIRPSDAESNFEHTIADDLPDERCGKMINYTVSMVFTGARPAFKNEFVLGGLDTVDTQFKSRMRLVPKWKKCRG